MRNRDSQGKPVKICRNWYLAYLLKGLFYSKKYGIERAIFSHHAKNVLHTCTPKAASSDDLYSAYAVRYWSLHDNRYLAYFKGHKSRVTSLALNPTSDSFLSASVGDAVLLWDWKSSSSPVGRMNITTGHSSSNSSILHSKPLVAFDPSGMVFAVAFPEARSIRMYDIKAFEKGKLKARKQSFFFLTYFKP